MVKQRVEKYAREQGAAAITPDVMEALRKRTFGNETPVFDMGRFQGLMPEGGWPGTESMPTPNQEARGR
jgi:hypothetical protein